MHIYVLLIWDPWGSMESTDCTYAVIQRIERQPSTERGDQEMELSDIVASIFSVIFILTLYFFIFRALRLMKRDVDGSDRSLTAGAPPQWGLEVLESGAEPHLRKGTVIPLRSGMTLGRKQDNTVVLHDPYISYHHLRFFIADGRYVIEDLDSTNGTLLNRDRLERKTYLRVNDRITLGSTVLRVISGEGLSV